MSRTAVRLLVCLLLVALPILPARTLNAAAHSDTQLSGQYESTYGGTTIWLKLCGQGSSYRFRSEALPNYNVLWDGTYGAINGCLSFSYRAVIGSQPGSQFLIYSAVMDGTLSTTDFLQRARADICTVVSAGNLSCSRQTRTLPTSFIDQPTAGQAMQGTATVSGWATDLASTSGPGVTDVHIYINAGAGDLFLGAASYGLARPDVASTYGDTRFTNAGYSFSFSTASLPNGAATIKVAMKSAQSGQWNWKTQQVTISNPTTPPNVPTLLAPADGATVAARTVTLSWQDAGDPDNAPRTYRDYNAELRASDNSWSTGFNWQTATSWQVTVPADGVYLWRVRASDGAAASDWTAERRITVTTDTPPSIVHTATNLGGLAENGQTTILMQICGTGPIVRLSSELKGLGNATTLLGDWTRPAVSNSCSPGYRPAINATGGTQIRLYSAVLGQQLSATDFRAQARKDVCRVKAVGQIECKPGADWYPDDTPPSCNTNPVACLNLTFPLASPLSVTQGRHDGNSYDFGKAGDPLNTEPVLASHAGYLTGGKLSDGAWCAWVSTKTNRNDRAAYTTAYCHVTANSIPNDKIGKWVAQGTQIALMGSTGNSTGPHVHFDLTHDGKKISPFPICGYTSLTKGPVSCKTTPAQAQSMITSAGGALNVNLSQGLQASMAATVEAPADLSFQFPAGATQAPRSAEFVELFAPAQPLDDMLASIRYFRLDAFDDAFNPATQLDQPYTAVLTYSDAELAALGIQESSLRLMAYDGSVWSPVAPCATCGVDPVHNTVTVVLNRFGEFALAGTVEQRIFLPVVQR